MYDCLGEVCVLILSAILLFNTLNSFSIKESKHAYFFLCIFCVMISTGTNIISIQCIEHFDPSRMLVSTIITTTYFTFLGLVPFFFSIYCYEFVSPYKRHKKAFFACILTPITVYLVVLFLNTWYNFIFRYDPHLGYTRGSLKNITYVITLMYAIFVAVAVFYNRKMLSRRIKIVFMIYPFLGVLISGIQFFSTYSVMAGTSSFATTLLVYLSIQSDLLEYDLQTGLLTGKHLSSVLKKKPDGFLTVISIENYTQLENAMSVYCLNSLMMKISDSMHSLFGRSSYHLYSNKLAVYAYNLELLKKNTEEFFSRFDQVKLDDNTTHHVDFIAATVELPTNAETYEAAIEMINNLLVRARATKGQKFICCDENYVGEMKRKQAVYSILDRELKLESSQFQVYFQPIYSLKEKRFVYAESLSRLKGTELGDIMPSEFIPIAEAKGLIERLGNVVFEKVCDFIAKNKSAVGAVSVNFSVYQMINPNIVDYILKTIRRFAIDPSSIIMEITESIFIDDLDLIRKTMMRLSENGIRFYLDDFGTGYSNFANVVALPFSTIKIDRSFVLMMEGNNDFFALLKSLINTFKENGLKILVEGVETKSQDELIRRTETDYIQGFLYSRPVSGDKYLQLLIS